MIISFHNISKHPKNRWELTPEDFKKIIKGISLDSEIHFDDARRGVYEFAFPIFKDRIKQGQKVTIFVVPNWIDGLVANHREQYSNFMNWEQLKELSKAGFEMGSHSLNHPNLTTLPSIDVIKELTESKELIELWTKSVVNKFAYPYGAYTERLMKIVKQYYSYAYGLMIPKIQSNWNIPRKTVIGNYKISH